MAEARCYGCMKEKKQPICEHCGYDEKIQNASHQLPAGTVLKEQYLIGRVLGQGGFGITYLGWDMYLDIPVAIKEYYPNGAVMRETSVTMEVASCGGEVGVRFRNNKERFLREAKMLARFSQVPEIVQIRNFFLANNTAYIVMEYVEGITLKQYVQKKGGKLSVNETFAILRPVMEALCKVHKSGLVHRDISPDNIMMLPGGGAKLLDFGAVRDVGDADANKSLTKSTEAILKQGYAPIEQYQSRGSLGPWTDVYALCATIYYCLTGQIPPEAPERLLNEPELDIRSLVPSLSKHQETVLKRGMELRTEKRIASMDELCEELFRVPEPPKKMEPRKKPERQKTGRRKLNPRFVIMCVLAALALVIVIILAAAGEGGAADSPTEPDHIVMETVVDEDQIFSGTCGENMTWELNLTTGEMIISGSGIMDDYHASWYESENLLPPWYDYREQITGLTVGDSVIYIGEGAFAECTNLKQAHFGNAVESIGPSAFENSGLMEIEFPESLQMIHNNAFGGTLLRKVVVPENVRELGHFCFGDCPELKDVTVGTNVSFCWDIGLGAVTFSNHHDDIVEDDFVLRGYQNTEAQEYARIMGIPFEIIGEAQWDAAGYCGDNVAYVLDRDSGFLMIFGEGEMWDFNGTWMAENNEPMDPNRTLPPWTAEREWIRSLLIDDGVTVIGENAFENCYHLGNLHFGMDLRKIKTQAFLSTGIDELVLPENVTEIEPYAFNWCMNLRYLRLPYTMEYLAEGAFNRCQNINELWAGPNTTLLSPDGMSPFNTTWEPGMPHNMVVYGIGGSDAHRFAEAYGYEFREGLMGYSPEEMGQCGEDVYWFYSQGTLILYGSGETYVYDVTPEDRTGWAEENYPESWLFESGSPFQHLQHDIGRIVIMPGITKLNHDLFWDLTRVETVEFGTVEEMIHTFSHCNFTEIILPESVREIGAAVFGSCRQLRKVTILGDAHIGSDPFNGCVGLEEIWFYGNTTVDSEDLFGTMNTGKITFYVTSGNNAISYAQDHGIAYEIIE